MHSITLIANPAKAPLTPAILEQFQTGLSAQGVETEISAWLADHEACDLTTEANDRDALYALAHEVLSYELVDVIIQAPLHRKKKMLISDMDSTMIRQECIDELADFVGMKKQVSEITERAMNGELDFKAALIERVQLLKGLTEETLQKAYTDRISFTPGARTLVQTMAEDGAHCMLVSGGFTFFTERVSRALGFHFHESNILEIKNGTLTGEVLEPIRDKYSKLTCLESHAKSRKLRHEEVLAVGDGANDLPMLQAAGLGVAFYAKPTVQQKANARVNHTDLTALLYAQGYHKDEFRV